MVETIRIAKFQRSCRKCGRVIMPGIEYRMLPGFGAYHLEGQCPAQSKCVICGKPTDHIASRGPACREHYNQLSD